MSLTLSEEGRRVSQSFALGEKREGKSHHRVYDSVDRRSHALSLSVYMHTCACIYICMWVHTHMGLQADKCLPQSLLHLKILRQIFH